MVMGARPQNAGGIQALKPLLRAFIALFKIMASMPYSSILHKHKKGQYLAHLALAQGIILHYLACGDGESLKVA